VSVFEKLLDENHKAWRAQVRQQRRPFKEWIGKTADAVWPEEVRHRVGETWGWKCYLSGAPIDPAGHWDVEHVVRVRDAGAAANRESNMRPVLRMSHREKTRRETKEQARAERKARANAGTKAAPKQEFKSREADVRPDQKKASRKPDPGGRLESLQSLPRRSFYK
jgi:hypothetical protein